ncbi:Ig-like domain-containing protein [Curtobacterium oceanosedimentum]|uniref:Ig-like domain-containing protein n=1 Tax=Curtobacterium oceanosedimentum TaxID=465820 RepID=UPI000A4BA5E1|nr:Ig-like domain-containing protein [Curtobacterium oceanosedimentum]
MRFPSSIVAVSAAVVLGVGAVPAHADTAPRAVDLDLGTAVLQRGDTGAVDIGFSEIGGRPGSVEGEVTVTAPAGTKIPASDNDAVGQYRNPGWPAWLATSSLRLTDARVNASRTQATYRLQAPADFNTNVQLRFAIPVEVMPTAPLDSHLSYTATGTRAGGPTGSWSVNGSTPTTVAAGLEGTGGSTTTLQRGTPTPVPVRATTTTRFGAVDGTVVVSAPAGTVFAPDQTTVSGWYEETGGARHEDGVLLTGGEPLEGGKRYRWKWRSGSTWTVGPATRLGWDVAVQTPPDAPASPGRLTAMLSGSTAQGPFSAEATTPTTVPVNDEVLVGADASPVFLERGATTPVESRLRTTVTTSSPLAGSNAQFTAPVGTTIADDAAIRGAYRLPGSEQWTAFDRDQLVDGALTDDRTAVTYRWDTTGWNLPAGTLLRFAVPVATPGDAPAGDGALTMTVTGSTPAGTFAASSSTSVQIPEAPVLAPVDLHNERVVAGWDNVLRGDAEPNATLRITDRFGAELASVTVDPNGSWTAVLPVAVNASELRLGLEQTLGDTTEPGGAVTLPSVAPPSVASSTTTMVPGLLNRFEGTGPAGARYRVVNRWGTDLVPGTSDIPAAGSWQFDRTVSNGAVSFAFRLQLAIDGWEARTPEFSASAASLVPATVTTKTVVPGTENRFEGTGTAAATYRVVNDWGTELVPGERTIGDDRHWEFRRVVDHRARDFRFRIEQRRGSQVLLSDLFVLPAAER